MLTRWGRFAAAPDFAIDSTNNQTPADNAGRGCRPNGVHTGKYGGTRFRYRLDK